MTFWRGPWRRFFCGAMRGHVWLEHDLAALIGTPAPGKLIPVPASVFEALGRGVIIVPSTIVVCARCGLDRRDPPPAFALNNGGSLWWPTFVWVPGQCVYVRPIPGGRWAWAWTLRERWHVV